jgi:hypothetical protein
MKAARSLSNSLFSLLSTAGAVLLFTATIAPASANSGDWSLVSAPPPPGPYRTVNLDPRVPGAEGIPMIGNTPGFAQPGESRVPVAPTGRLPGTHAAFAATGTGALSIQDAQTTCQYLSRACTIPGECGQAELWNDAVPWILPDTHLPG